MIEGWTDFFEGQVTAGAALTGLVFVAISINLERIVGYAGLVGRAAEAMLLLVAPVFVGLAALIDGQSLRTIGFEVLGISVVVLALSTRILATSGWVAARDRPQFEYVSRCVLVAAALVPGVIAGIMLVSGSSDGFYAQAISTGLCFAVGLVDAWVLLVEIVR